MSFSEEASHEGPGHFPGKIHKKLSNGKYEIIRKLGYGPRSSTWLVWRKSGDRYFAVKIYTIAASTRAEEVELPILQSTLDLLHGADIMHGAVNAGNVYFETAISKPELDSENRPSIKKLGKFHTVASQPLKHSFSLRDKNIFESEWPLQLVNLGHAQKSTFKPESGNDYLSAPETLSPNPSVSPKTDMWQLGCMILKLLTGSNPPFISGDEASSRLASIQAALGDGSTKSIEALLVDVLEKRDAAEAAVFIRDCLRLDPSRRLIADQALRHRWLAGADLG
ncbi:hypothetical protein M413DRAFT_14463 [Hebeloma cylindrosporum]|uniref:non-specific serine/threonine protein kinase n=1 Tax=Hebeloma cylindrosporum TaxID=76867 RepID=A0A0C3BUA6_HEBCY|nr:hypothetical protein M413DRAFT_14463 [Hebeloma cylindrosporum h7]